MKIVNILYDFDIIAKYGNKYLHNSRVLFIAHFGIKNADEFYIK